jgi:hypothetical protein
MEKTLTAGKLACQLYFPEPIRADFVRRRWWARGVKPSRTRLEEKPMRGRRPSSRGAGGGLSLAPPPVSIRSQKQLAIEPTIRQ